MVQRQTFGRGNQGSKPPAAISKREQFRSLCLCLLEETLKAVGPTYQVSMSGAVKYPTQGNGKNLSWAHKL